MFGFINNSLMEYMAQGHSLHLVIHGSVIGKVHGQSNLSMNPVIHTYSMFLAIIKFHTSSCRGVRVLGGE